MKKQIKNIVMMVTLFSGNAWAGPFDSIMGYQQPRAPQGRFFPQQGMNQGQQGMNPQFLQSQILRQNQMIAMLKSRLLSAQAKANACACNPATNGGLSLGGSALGVSALNLGSVGQLPQAQNSLLGLSNPTALNLGALSQIPQQSAIPQLPGLNLGLLGGVQQPTPQLSALQSQALGGAPGVNPALLLALQQQAQQAQRPLVHGPVVKAVSNAFGVKSDPTKPLYVLATKGVPVVVETEDGTQYVISNNTITHSSVAATGVSVKNILAIGTAVNAHSAGHSALSPSSLASGIPGTSQIVMTANGPVAINSPAVSDATSLLTQSSFSGFPAASEIASEAPAVALPPASEAPAGDEAPPPDDE